MGAASSRKSEKSAPAPAPAQSNPIEEPAQQSSTPNSNKKAIHNFEEIVDDKNKTDDELEGKLRSTGIFLAEETKKYWLDEESNNCFTIFPKGMSITWGDDPRYWVWRTLGEGGSDASQIEVAELRNVCWLQIQGILQLSYLNPEVTYEVILEVKLEEHANGWSTPVDLQLKLPDGLVQERKEILRNKPRGRWLPLMVGKIRPQAEQRGDVVVSLFQHGGHWKGGLVIKGITIRTRE